MKDMFYFGPKIQKGDIVRVEWGKSEKWSCHIVSDVGDRFLETDLGENLVYVEEVIAVYRFCGKGFDCIWQDEEAMARYAKEAGDGKHGSEEAD